MCSCLTDINCRIYDSKVREIAHFTNAWGEEYIIINQSHWYPANKYTEEQAIQDFMSK